MPARIASAPALACAGARVRVARRPDPAPHRRMGAGLPVSRSAVSHQLRLLRDADFVEIREWGSERRYRLAWNAMDRVDAAVEGLWQIWENRVGWPYEVLAPEPPPRLHRAGRRGLRGRTRAEIEPRNDADDWFRYLSD